ncbi:MAG: ABC transporter substrate-binding protein [Phreatobacter sp.]|jgi:branched-chain amino acid transport system substrate-binding protein|uniref:ABC transporter substrate-binding protein n=1 Tax=Phreatobacter sp. TaxID=1966341 RepID=UPI004036D44B
MPRPKLAPLIAACLLWAAAATPALSQVSDEAVRIGVLNDMSGPYADITGRSSLIAVQMAVEDFGGTVLGRKIEVLSADHQNKPDVGSAIVRRWYDERGVDVVVGLGASSVALAVRSYTREMGKLDIATSSGSSDLTGTACSPTGFHWMHDTYALAKTLATAAVRNGGNSWFFVTADYSFGHVLERDAARFVEAAGGTVLGRVRAPINSTDFSSFLLQAQASGARIIGLANGGNDTINTIKTAREFGIVGGRGNQSLASLLLMITDVHALGLEAAQGMLLTEGFYWDQSDEARAFSQRFLARRNLMPNMMNAADYSATLHYLKAVQAAGTDEPRAVAAAMRSLPINDATLKNGRIRSDGRVERDMYLFRVKAPGQSRSPWDLYEQVATVAFADAFRPLSEGGCPTAVTSR